MVGCGLLCLVPIRLKNSLMSSLKLERTNWYFLIFCMEIIITWRWDLRLPLLVGCDQVRLWANQISGFFDYQYRWNESIDTFVWRLSIFSICFFPGIFYQTVDAMFYYLVMTCSFFLMFLLHLKFSSSGQDFKITP